MRIILNVIWLVLCGIWMAILYALAGIICFILIITIPFGIAAFRISNYVLWPFGRTIAPREGGMGPGAVIGNVIWVILFGWELAIGHLVAGILPVRHDHRHPAGPRQLQDHPHLLPAAGGPDSSGRRARDLSSSSQRWLVGVAAPAIGAPRVGISGA